MLLYKHDQFAVFLRKEPIVKLGKFFVIVALGICCFSIVATTRGEKTPLPKPVKVRMMVTAYCPCKICCGPHANGITASGEPVTANDGYFCAAPKRLPFGTMITVPGYNEEEPVPVLDRGGAIKGNHIDVFFPTHKQALDWGVKYLTVTIWQ